MKHISILVLKEAILGSIDAPYQIFTKVNEMLSERNKPQAFEVDLVGITKQTKINGHGIICDQTLEEVKQTDLIVIPMICNGFEKAIRANQEFIPWIQRQYKNNAEIASLCSGSFFLASSGLLDGKNCAVHWATANEFGLMFPKINQVNEKIISYDRGIYSSGGYYSYLNLILLFVEKYAGRDMAVLVSKMFEIEIERKLQSPYMIFRGQKEHADEDIRRAQDFIEQNYNEKISIEQLTSMLALGRRNFERRFKKATSNTVIHYLQRVKIEAVKKGLETGRKTVMDLMYDVGYADMKSFRTIFKKFTGLSPNEYRNKYNSRSQRFAGDFPE